MCYVLVHSEKKWLRTGGPRTAHHRGTCSSCVSPGLRGSSSQLLKIGLFSTSVILHFLPGSEVPFHFFGLDVWATESKTRSLGLIWPHSHFRRTSAHCVTGSHGRTREHFLSLSVIAEGCNFEAVVAPPVPTNRNSLQSDGIQTSSTHFGMFQFYRKRQTTPRWPRTWSLSWQQVTFSLSRKGASFQHDRFHYVALSRHSSFAVDVDFVRVFRCIRSETHRRICLVHERSNTTLPSTNTLFDKTVAFGS